MCTWNIPQDGSHVRSQNILLNLRRLKLCQYFFTIMVQNQISTIRKKKIEKTKTFGVKTYTTKQTIGVFIAEIKDKKKRHENGNTILQNL